MKILNYILQRHVFYKVIKASGLLFAIGDREEIERFQTETFNNIWEDAYTNIPFYSDYKNSNSLPNRIESLSELSKWPIITKQQIIASGEKVLRKEKPDSYVITSGSTGLPLKIPTRNGGDTQYNMWIGRAANGILPGEKTFLIWGHHYLHGTGFKQIINKKIRDIKDSLLGYMRVSAYDTSKEAMTQIFQELDHFKPQIVIGYSTTVLSFVRCNKSKTITKAPKLVLCTAGPLMTKELGEIESFFHAPVCMEYGSMEAAVMAYTLPESGSYRVFWNTHILQGKREDCGVKNIVTTIFPKYFPLIRYDIGDILNISEEEERHNSIINIQYISGRPTDTISLSNGVSFNAMLTEACVEHLPDIISHQLIVSDDKLSILITGNKFYSKSELESVRHKINTVVPSLIDVTIEIEQVEELHKNKGGKIPLVIRQ